MYFEFGYFFVIHLELKRNKYIHSPSIPRKPYIRDSRPNYSVSFLHRNTNFRHPIQAHAVGNGEIAMSWTFLVFENRHLRLYSHKINFCFAPTEAVGYEVSQLG